MLGIICFMLHNIGVLDLPKFVSVKLDFSRKLEEEYVIFIKFWFIITLRYYFRLMTYGFLMISGGIEINNLLNSFVLTAPFLYPLKISENLTVF